jgi:hypothetical protein
MRFACHAYEIGIDYAYSRFGYGVDHCRLLIFCQPPVYASVHSKSDKHIEKSCKS